MKWYKDILWVIAPGYTQEVNDLAPFPYIINWN